VEPRTEVPLDFMGTARKRFKACQDDEREIRKEAELDLDFLSGNQWDPQLKIQREQANRPAHVDNRLPTFVQQVANEARLNKPQIKFNPRKEASKDTAEVLEGLARAIQYDSDAAVAFETALDYGAGGSFGYFRFLPDYDDDDGDEQILKIVPVLDPFAVYGILYPACFGREPMYAFVTEDMPKDEYMTLYPKTELASLGFEEANRRAGEWVGTETIRIAEYWDVKQEITENKSGSRKIVKNHVSFCKINGLEKLPDTETKWLGYCIPIVPVLGKMIMKKGKPMLFSLIRFMRDPQKLMNYVQTRIAETLATAPISPFIGPEGFAAGHEKEWQTINTTLRPYVEYKTVDVQGKPVPPPQRQTFEPPIQALSEFRAQLIDDQKSISGIFDASLGKQSNEQSGIALQKRQQQSASTNLHFMDNLERAFKKGGDILADAIPKYYDWPGIINILGEDETAKLITINQPAQDDSGNPYHHDFKVGKYDVAVTMGRGWSTKRLETFDMMSQVIGGNPQLLMMVGDIFFGNSDMAGANQLKDRFKKIIGLLHPGLVDDSDGSAESKLQAAQAQLQNLMMQHQQLTQALQEATEEIRTKKVENDAKFAIERLHSETQIAVAEINTKAQNERERLKLELDLNNKLTVQANEAQLSREQRAHEAALGAADAHAASQQAEQAHGHKLVEGEQAQAHALEQGEQAGSQALIQQEQAAKLAPKPEKK